MSPSVVSTLAPAAPAAPSPAAVAGPPADASAAIRASFQRFPAWSQHFWTWVTGKALPGQQPRFRLTPTMYLGWDLMALLAGVASAWMIVEAGGTALALLPLCWALTTSASRVCSTVIAHQCLHASFTGRRGTDKAIAQVLSTIVCTEDADQYYEDHIRLHHRPKSFATLADPTISHLLFLGFRPGMSVPALWRRLVVVVVSPRFHLHFLATRLRHNLLRSAPYRRIMGFAYLGAGLGVVAWWGEWLTFFLAVVVPLVFWYQIVALLEFLSEHAWFKAKDTTLGGRAFHVSHSWGRFNGDPLPDRGLATGAAVRAWSRWLVRLALYHVPARVLVVPGDLAAHDFHHPTPHHPGVGPGPVRPPVGHRLRPRRLAALHRRLGSRRRHRPRLRHSQRRTTGHVVPGSGRTTDWSILMTWHILKFGGSSFLELSDYRRVAAYLHRLAADPSRRLVVVVSGMSGTTGRLLDAALTVDPDLEPAVQDQVLATAEMLGASLLRAALHAQGRCALDLWAPQLGIRSDSNATRARILAVDPGPVRAAAESHRVVVVAGGQALDPDQRITMLGRNSSDLTAVALAAALGSHTCEIFSDVAGVYTADPYVVPSARLLPQLSYRQCAAMSASGAKVLHWGSVRHAAERGVKILCRAFAPGPEPNHLVATTGSVVGAGAGPGAGGDSGATAIVGDARAQLYRLRPRSDVALALTSLRESGFTVVRTERRGDVFAFAGGQVGTEEALQRVGPGAERLDGWGLVTVVWPDGRASRRPVRVEDLDETVRALHRRHHGPASDPDVAAPGLSPKRRSAHSGLFVGGDLATTGAGPA